MLYRVTRNALTYGLGDALAKILTFFAFPIYTNFFSVGEIGTISLISSFVSLVALFVGLGIGGSVQRFYWENSEQDRASIVFTGFASLLLAAGCSSVVLGLTVFLLEPQFLSHLGGNRAAIMIAMASSASTLVLQLLWDIGRMRFKVLSFTLMNFVKAFSTIGFTLLLIKSFPGRIECFFIGELASILLISPAAFYAVRKDFKLDFRPHLIVKMVRFGFPFVLAGAAYWIFTYIDRWMLAEFSTVTEVGLYSVASRYSMGLLILTSAFGQAWSPLVLKLFAEDPNYHIQVRRIARVWFIALSFAGLFLCLFSHEILRYTTPKEYWGASSSLLYLSIAMVLSGTTQITALGISLAKKSKLIAIGSWSAACVNVLLNLALIPRFGSEGAAIATVISYLFLTAFYYANTYKLSAIRIPIDSVLISASVLAGAVLSRFFIGEPFVSFEVWAAKLLVFMLLTLAATVHIFKIEDVWEKIRRYEGAVWKIGSRRFTYSARKD